MTRVVAAIRARLAGHGGHHRTIATALVATTGLLVIAKLAGLAKEMMVAFNFGTDVVAGLYAFAFLLALWPVGVWTSVASSVLVPMLVKLDDRSAGGSDQFRGELFALSLIGGILASAVMFGVLRVGADANLFNLSPSANRLLAETAPAFAAITAVGFVNAQLTCQLLASRNPTVSLLDGLPSFCVILFLSLHRSHGPWPLVLGTVFGFVAQTVALMLVQARTWRLSWPRFTFRSDAWPGFWSGVRVLVVSQALLSATGPIDQIAMTGLGHGANATLGYANRIVLLATSLISLALSRAILPVLASASEDRRKAWSLATTWALALLVAAALASMALAVLAPWIVHLLFERGNFTAQDTLAVSNALRFGLLQMPFYCAGMVLAQYVAATQRYTLFLWGNALNLLVKLAANALLIPPLGVAGAMLATAVMYAVSVAFLWIVGRPGRGAPETSLRAV